MSGENTLLAKFWGPEKENTSQPPNNVNKVSRAHQFLMERGFPFPDHLRIEPLPGTWQDFAEKVTSTQLLRVMYSGPWQSKAVNYRDLARWVGGSPKKAGNNIGSWHRRYAGGLIINQQAREPLLLMVSRTGYDYPLIPRGLYRAEGTGKGYPPVVLPIPIGWKSNTKGENNTDDTEGLTVIATFRKSDLTCIRSFFRPFSDSENKQGSYANLSWTRPDPGAYSGTYWQNDKMIAFANLRFLLRREGRGPVSSSKKSTNDVAREPGNIHEDFTSEGIFEELPTAFEPERFSLYTFEAFSAQALGKLWYMMAVLVAYAHLSDDVQAKENAVAELRNINTTLLAEMLNSEPNSARFDVNAYFDYAFVDSKFWNDTAVVNFQKNPRLADTSYEDMRDPLRMHPDIFSTNLKEALEQRSVTSDMSVQGNSDDDDAARWKLPATCLRSFAKGDPWEFTQESEPEQTGR